MGFVVINHDELEKLFQLYGYFLHPVKGAKESASSKFFNEQGLRIMFWTTFEGRVMRGYAEDAIRCLLTNLMGDVIFLQLHATYRNEKWQIAIPRRIHLLEMLITTAKPCPTCGGMTVPRCKTKKPYQMYWVCLANNKHPKIHSIPKDLEQDLLKMRFYGSRDPEKQARKKQLQKAEDAKTQGTLFPE